MSYKIAGVGDVLVTIFASIIISFNFNCPTKHTQIENKCLCVRANLRPIPQLSHKGFWIWLIFNKLLHHFLKNTLFLQNRWQGWTFWVVKMTMFASIIFSSHFNFLAPMYDRVSYVQCHMETDTTNSMLMCLEMSGFQQAFAARWENTIHIIKWILLNSYEAAFCQWSVIFSAS